MNANKQDAGGEVTNPDNAGGLPELPPPDFMLRWDSMRAAYYVSRPNVGSTDVYTADQMRAYGELCRAAPAGGDDWPFLEEIGRDGKPTGYWIRKGSPAAARMSAPAGSGEVEEMAKRLLVEASDVVENTCLHDVLMRAAALLRKLQRPTEEDAYVIEQMGRLLAEIAIIVNGPEPAMTRWSYHDLPEKVRKLQQGAE